MSASRITAAVLGIGLVLAYAGGSALWVQTASGWYLALRKPAWQPPDVVFGLIWPYNFLVLGIAMFVLARRGTEAALLIGLASLTTSVAAALLWSYLFYGPHSLTASTVALVLAAVLTVPLLVTVFRTSPALGWALVPYQLWLCVAASLSWGYAALNR